jgi:hypothetical protein
MPSTRNRWESASPFSDGQIFLAADADWLPLVAASAVLSTAGPGLLTLNIPASTTANLWSPVSQMLRSGQLATAAFNQRQFGTAALVPGPSGVSGTSGPSALPVSAGVQSQGFPPWAGSVNPALHGGLNGAEGKGLQINWVDAIYEVDTGAITSVTFQLTQTKMPAVGTSAAPVVTNLIALAANGLPVAANTAGQATRTRITIASPVMSNGDGNELIANINFVTPAANTVKFYGCILGVSYNWQ